MPTLCAFFPIFRQILIRERITLVHGHQASSVMSHEAILFAKTMGYRVAYTDHSLFGFADAARCAALCCALLYCAVLLCHVALCCVVLYYVVGVGCLSHNGSQAHPHEHRRPHTRLAHLCFWCYDLPWSGKLLVPFATFLGCLRTDFASDIDASWRKATLLQPALNHVAVLSSWPSRPPPALFRSNPYSPPTVLHRCLIPSAST